MSVKEHPTLETNDNKTHELHPSALQACFPHVAFDFHKFAKDTEAEFQEVHKQLTTSHSSWSLTEMAAAGFYHTLVKSSVQWFCCGLVLFTIKFRCTPYKQHQKICPTCGFVLGKEVGNISKYDICVQKLERNPAEYACRYCTEDARGTKPNSLARAGFFFTAFEPSVFFAQKLHLFEL
uniref:Uncharacterized protein n=1 Tax=Strix occidentalis caurina TaxID=311401 RepID=A0A8D0F1J9_STROC